MNAETEIVLDPRGADEFLAAILARRAGYVPEWIAPEGSVGAGFAAIVARMFETAANRLNGAPANAKLAFLDAAGIRLTPARSARAPLVFKLSAQAQGGLVPAGTPVAAPPPPGGTRPITFETERAATVTAGTLKQIVSLWPGRDEYIDHSAALAAGKPVQPFARALREPTPHHLYLEHPVLLALAGNVLLAVEFELTSPSAAPLGIEWEYWDGEVWREFLSTDKQCQPPGEAKTALDNDSTSGLTASGHYLLRADVAQSGKTTVNGFQGNWIRARLTEPLPPDPGQALPEADAIRISNTVDRALKGRIRVAQPRAPKAAATDGDRELRAPKAVQPAALSGMVTNEAGSPLDGAIVSVSAGGVTFSSQPSKGGEYTISGVSFGTDYAYEAVFAGITFSGPDASLRPKQPATEANSAVDITLVVEGLAPDTAFAGAQTLDVSKPFFPLGQAPQPGDAFYVSNEETFAKPGAAARMYVARTRSQQDENQITGDTLAHQLDWEYWNGRRWSPLPVKSHATPAALDLTVTEFIAFTVPEDMEILDLNGKKARWIRARLQSGSYGFKQQVTFQTGAASVGNTPPSFTYIVPQPPVLASVRIGYTWQFGPFHPERVLTYNDFQYRDRTTDARWPGVSFLPFERVSDVTPAVYFGFDKKPPAGQLGIYFDIAEDMWSASGPALEWEYHDGFAWRRTPAEDETARLRRPGMVRVLAQAGSAPLARFGAALHWFRARLAEDGPPGEPTFNGVFPNAIWASERQSWRDLPVGSSTGVPQQSFVIPQIPILPGETLEVRELAGARTATDWRILAMELSTGDASFARVLEEQLRREGPALDAENGALRLRRNRSKQPVEAWVRWSVRESLHFSGPRDRHYAIDRASGRVYFGDGVNGLVPPAGAQIRMREMASGGGSTGNVKAGAIQQLLGVVAGVESVANPRPAEGGADGEPLEQVSTRGPRTIRHRGRAVLPADYETLAREASPAVAFARAIPCRDPQGVRVPGWVTLIVIPHGDDPRPFPSPGMRDEIRGLLEERASADLAAAARIHVTGPQYLPVDVNVTIASIDAGESAAVELRVRAALERFLHPILGGPSGSGWDMGRGVYLSDVASVVERVEGVDAAPSIELAVDGQPSGERVAVAEDRIVAAGAIAILLAEAER